MTGQISSLPIELAAVLVAASMLAGAIDIVRQPGWAWKRVEESKPAYLILDLLLPVIGLAIYAFRVRPKVTAAVAAGLTPALLVEPDGTKNEPTSEPEAEPAERAAPTTAIAADTNPFAGFREVTGNGHPGPWESEITPEESELFEVSGTFFSTGAANRTMRHPLALARAYRPKQRTSLFEEGEPEIERDAEVEVEPKGEPDVDAEAEIERQIERQPHFGLERPQQTEREPEPSRVQVVTIEAPTVPSGWKVDPTGRHEFRYWDGSYWTENVADDGEESRDAVSA